jgi:outer membrane protein assembly factor BamA
VTPGVPDTRASLAISAAALLGLLSLYSGNALAGQDSLAPPARVDRVVVSGNKVTAEDVILREIPFTFPAVLRAEDLKLIEHRVMNLRLFNRVELRVEARDGEQQLTVLVTESWYVFPAPILFIGEHDWNKIGYGLQVTDSNFRGRNEKLRVGGWFGYNPSYFLNYSIPWIGERQRLSLGVGASKGLSVNKIFGFQEARQGFSVRVGKRVSLKLESSVQFSLTRIKLPREYQSFSVSGTGQDLVPSLSWQTRWDNRDLTEYPRRGNYVAVNIQRTGFARDQPEYWRVTVDGRLYEPVFGSATLPVRQLLVINSGNVPVYDRVYLGFSERIRGYYNLVVPEPARYAEYGSYNISLTSVELRFPILPVRYFSIEHGPIVPRLFRNLQFGISAGVFADSGFVWRSAGDLRLRTLYAGYGVGLHFHLPYIHVFRVEYALNRTGRGQLIFSTGVRF